MIAIVLAALAVGPARQEEIPMEWTMEQARKAWKPMVHPIQHVGVPGFEFQTGVMWDGALVFGPLDFLGLQVMKDDMAMLGASPMHVSFMYGNPPRFVDRKGTNNPAIRRRLCGGRLPMPTVETRDGDLAWEETVFAHLLGRPVADGMRPTPADKLITQVSITVKNAGWARREGRLSIHFGTVDQVRFGYKSRQEPELARSLVDRFEGPFGWVDGKVRCAVPSPSKGKLAWNAGTKLLEWTVPLKPGETADLRIAIPYGLLDEPDARRMLADDPKVAEAEAVAAWKHLQYGPAQIETPDPWLNDYLVAVAGQMAQQVAYRHHPGLWMYKTSPNHYEGYWPCNAAKALPAFDYRGLKAINEQVLGGFIQVQTDEIRGLDRWNMGGGKVLEGEGFAKTFGFMGNFGEWTANPLLISHGLGMWALANHYRVTRDDKWLKSPYRGPSRKALRSPLEAMIAAFDWVGVQRRRTMREEKGTKVAYWGLLPAASAHDWLAGNTIFNDAFCIYGMTEVVRLLREIRHPRAEELAKELVDYRDCLHDRYAEATRQARPFPLPDGTKIPFVPRMVQELDWAKPDWTYTGYSPLRCGAFGVFDPHDELVDWSLACLEAGMPKGEGAYYDPALAKSEIADVNWADISDPNAERHWLWRHYVEYETMWPVGGHLFLARDDLPRYFEWFFNNMAFVVHQDWRVGVESIDGVPSNAPGEGERWMAVRSMFVHEREGYDGSEQSLFLLQALPRSWLRPGAHLAVRSMPTSFGGKVDLTVDMAADGGSVQVALSIAKLAVKPAGVAMRLRSGDGRPLASATVNGAPVPVQNGDVIRLPVATSGRFKIVGQF